MVGPSSHPTSQQVAAAQQLAANDAALQQRALQDRADDSSVYCC